MLKAATAVVGFLLTPQAAQAQATLTATAGNGEVTLSWTYGQGDAPAGELAKFAYQQKEGDSGSYGSWIVIPGSDENAIAYTVTGLTNGTKYYFKITQGYLLPTFISDNDFVSNEVSATPVVPTAGVTVSKSRLTITEGSTGSYTVKLNTAPSGNVVVTPSSDNTDVTVTPASLTFTSSTYSAPQTFMVRAGADEDTTNDTATVSHGVTGSGAYSSVTAAPVAVTDNTPTLSFDTGSSDVSEIEGQSLLVAIGISGTNSSPASVSVSLTFSPRSSSSFDASDIPGGLGPKTFTVSLRTSSGTIPSIRRIEIPTSADAVVEGSEAFRITLNDGTGYALGSTTTLDGRLRDGTAPAKPTGLSATAGNREVSLSWSNPDNDSITGYQLQRKKGSDAWGSWTNITSSGAGTTRHTVTGLENGAEYRFRICARNTGFDSDTEITVNQFSAQSDVAKATPGLPVTLTATAGDEEVTLNWTVTGVLDPNPTGWFFRQKPSGGSWDGWVGTGMGAGGAIRSYTVTGLNNGTEYGFQVQAYDSTANSISNSQSNEATATPTAATVTTPGVTISPTSLTVTEATGAGQTGTYTVVLDTDPGATVTVTPISSDEAAATVSAALVFDSTNWETAKTVTVTGVDDADRTDETVTVSHTVTDYGSGPTAVTSADSVTVTVTDDDVPAKPTGLSAAGGNVQVTLNWSDPEDESITGYKVRQKKGSAGWGGWSAIADSDDETVRHMVTGLENGSRYRFRIRAVNSNGDGAQSEVVEATPTAPATPGVSITPTSLTVEEGSSGEYTVVLDTAPSASVTVTVAGTSGEVTVTGSPVIFSTTNWTTAKTVMVNAGADADATNDSATLTHSSASTDSNYGASLSIDDVSVTVTDTTPTLQLRTNPAAVREGENISLTVTSNMDLTGDVTVKLLLAARSSSSFDADNITGTLGPRDFTASFGSTGSKTGTVSIATSRDATTEGAEAYRITLNDGSGYVVGTSKTADGTLNDGTISLSIGDVSAAEDGTFTFTVTASPTPSSPVTFKYKVTKESMDTAIAGTDFTAVSTATAKTIAANAASTTITVTVTDDDLDESNETFTVTLSEPSVGVRLAAATATGTITDDDNSPVLADIANETIKLGPGGGHHGHGHRWR